ncbi:hypothetical protein AURDEDRAFT_182677 [Auricularia subglabra TFB-10046 SS5]|nr:hypothetical protein AURDEDRAFT_182677 [Auricularia subglabra TFB-10046 SS5]
MGQDIIAPHPRPARKLPYSPRLPMSDRTEPKTDSANTVEACPPDEGPTGPVDGEEFATVRAGLVKEPARPHISEQDLYLRLVPSHSDTVVNQVKRTVYYRAGDEALYAVMDTRLVAIEWVQLFVRHNNTSQMEQHQTRFLTRLTVANGTSASQELGVSAAFRGLGLSFGASRTTFSSHETTEEREQTTTYDVPPRASLYVYQRQYRFVQRVWWILDAWNELWTIGANGTYATVTADIGVTISADERISSDRPLTGTLAVPVQAGPRPEREGNQRRRQFMNATSRARSSIERTIASANTPNRSTREIQIGEDGEGN